MALACMPFVLSVDVHHSHSTVSSDLSSSISASKANLISAFSGLPHEKIQVCCVQCSLEFYMLTYAASDLPSLG